MLTEFLLLSAFQQAQQTVGTISAADDIFTDFSAEKFCFSGEQMVTGLTAERVII